LCHRFKLGIRLHFFFCTTPAVLVFYCVTWLWCYLVKCDEMKFLFFDTLFTLQKNTYLLSFFFFGSSKLALIRTTEKTNLFYSSSNNRKNKLVWMYIPYLNCCFSSLIFFVLIFHNSFFAIAYYGFTLFIKHYLCVLMSCLDL